MTVDSRRLRHKRDRLRQLRAFCHAARLQSFSLAAAHLGISQPTVSLHVRELELELEAVLFERGSSPFVLTVAGERLHQLAWPLVEALDRLPDIFPGAHDGDLAGKLRIAAGPGAVAFVLPRLVKQFRDRHPNVQVRVRTSRMDDAQAPLPANEGRPDGDGDRNSVDDVRELLLANEVDLAMGAAEASLEDALYWPGFSYHMVLIAPPDHPLAGRDSVRLAETTTWPFVAPLAGTRNREVGKSMARRFGVEFHIAVETRGWLVIKDYVAAGIGVAIVPDLFVLEDDRVSIVRIEELDSPRSFGFFSRRNRYLSPPAEAFLRMAAPHFPTSHGR